MENEDNLNPEELRELKTQYNKAKDILEKINSLSIRYDAAYKAFETRSIDVEKVATDVREKAVLIENSKDESAKLVTEIKGNLENIQLSISQIEAAAIKFEGIKGRIEGKEPEMDALLLTAKGLRDDINKAKNSAQQKLTDIDALFVQVQAKITQMQKAHESFVGVHAKITDSNTGLQAILDQSVDLQKQSNSTFAEIKSFHEQSKKYLEQAEVNKTETDKIKTAAQESLLQINLNRDEVKKITALITDTGFEHAFQKREKMLRWSSVVWLIILLLSIGGLVYMLYVLFNGYFDDLNKIPEASVILFRFTLTSPLIITIAIAVREYGNERSLNEKYAFKAAMAAVIRNHTKFLIEVDEVAGNENAQFIREALGGIYDEPYETGIKAKEIRQDLKIALEKNDIRGKTGVAKILDEAKELRSLFPDETIKAIIDLVAKLK